MLKHTEEDYPRGLILSFTLKSVENNDEGFEGFLPDDLRSVLEEYATVKNIDFKTGDSSGYIEFEDENGAGKARSASRKAVRGGLRVKNCVVFLRLVQEDTEKGYWTRLRGLKELKAGEEESITKVDDGGVVVEGGGCGFETSADEGVPETLVS